MLREQVFEHMCESVIDVQCPDGVKPGGQVSIPGPNGGQPLTVQVRTGSFLITTFCHINLYRRIVVRRDGGPASSTRFRVQNTSVTPSCIIYVQALQLLRWPCVSPRERDGAAARSRRKVADTVAMRLSSTVA